MSQAGPTITPKDQWHSISVRVPFKSPSLALVAKRALDVDREQNAQFVERRLTVDDSFLDISYRATTIRLLRLSTNSFLSSLDLVLQTISAFDPDLPRLSDEELAERRILANKDTVGGGGGIELKGDGVGAGSGEEVKG